MEQYGPRWLWAHWAVTFDPPRQADGVKHDRTSTISALCRQKVGTGDGMTDALSAQQVGCARSITNGHKSSLTKRFSPLHRARHNTTMAIKYREIGEPASVQEVLKG